MRRNLNVTGLRRRSICPAKPPLAMTVWWGRGHLPLGMNLQQRLLDGYARFVTGPTEPLQKRQGFGRSRGPQPPTEAADGARGRPWRPDSRAGGGVRRRRRRWRQAVAPGSTRPVPGSIDPISRAEPSRAKPGQGERIKEENWVVPKGVTPVFPSFPVFLVPWINPLPVFDSLTVFRHRGTKKQAMLVLSPATP